MTSADWAAWVAAAGGILSVASTSYIAVLQTKRSNRIEEEAEDLKSIRRGALIDEAQRITAQIVELHKQCTARVRPTEDQITGWTFAYDEYQTAIDAECDRLLMLRQFAATDVAIYVTLEKIARTSRIQRRDAHTSQGIAGMTSHRIAEQAAKLAEELDRYR